MSASSNTGTDQFDSYRKLCWDNAVNAFGTSYVFQQRAHTLKTRLQWVNYVGVAVPVVVGALVLSFGIFSLLAVVITAAGVVGVIQMTVNLWSIIGRWVEEYSYAISSIAANDSLSIRYRELAQNPPSELDALRQMYERLQIEDTMRRDQDLQHDIEDYERRMGMRAALRQFQRKCTACEQVPTSMKPSDCGVCGSFKYSGS